METVDNWQDLSIKHKHKDQTQDKSWGETQRHRYDLGAARKRKENVGEERFGGKSGQTIRRKKYE